MSSTPCPAPGNEDLPCRDCEPAWTFDGALLTDTTTYLDVDRPACTTARGFLDATVRRIVDGHPGEIVVGLPDGAIAAMEAYYSDHPITCGECAACRDADDSDHRLAHAAGAL